MSIRVMTMIWDTCLYQGGTLNVLLAMADFANDKGGDIFPGIEYLAAKCRQSPRATQDCLKRLRADGTVKLLDDDGDDLGPDENAKGGRGHRTEYRIDLKRVQELQGLHQADEPDCEHCRAGRKGEAQRAQKSATKGEKSGIKGEEIPLKGEVSRSVYKEEPSEEPSREPPEEPASRPAPVSQPVSMTFPGFEPPTDSFEIPAFLLRNGDGDQKPKSPKAKGDRTELDQAYDLYNETAERVGWPVCQRRSTMRDGHLRRRIQEVGGLDGWKLVLERASASDFLCGMTSPRDGGQPFRADIDFITRESSFIKIMEGKYDNRTGSQGSGAGGVLAAASRVAANRAAARRTG